MVIIKLAGGLGNQMFEYALYVSLRARGRQVKIDDVSDYKAADRRPVQLPILGASYERASDEEIVEFTDSSMALSHRLRRKLTGRRSLSYRERDMEFDPEVFRRDPAYLEGFFQSEAYFTEVKEEVRRAFSFRGLKLPEQYQRYLTQMEETVSVSVHVRRGDYLDESHRGTYDGICTVGYYEKAMERIRESCPEAEFFFFSNDVEWTKRQFAGPHVTIVEGGSEETGYLDLYLMSRCRHHIIANSSFSWWGAWLGQNPDKLVIAPSRWLNGRECKDIYTEDMIRL